MGTPLSSSPKGLIRLGDQRAPEHIYVARTQRAALDLYQQDGLPDRSLICRLEDDGLETDSAFADLVGRHPGAMVHVALDTGEDEWKAQAFEARLSAALRKVRAPGTGVTVRRSIPLELSPGGSHAVSTNLILNENSREQPRDSRTRQDPKAPSLRLIRS